jgi:di/tricarboxylate transporter
LQERLWQLHVENGSTLVNRTLTESQIGENYGVSVLAIQRNHHFILAPTPTTTIHHGDTLLVLGRQDRVEQLAQSNGLQIHSASDWQQSFRSEDIDLFEIVVAPRASIAGKSLKELHFREKYGLSAVALWRENRIYRTDVGEMPLRFGDALLMLGKKDHLQWLQSEPDFILLTPIQAKAASGGKSMVTALALLFAIGASALGLLSVAEAMFSAALLLILARVITMEEAYQSIEWRVIFIVAGLLPLGIAMTKSGLTSLISGVMLDRVGHFGALPLLMTFWGLATVFTQVVSGQTTAVIFSPIAISTALALHLNPQSFAMAIAIASSTAFLTPISHSVNLFVMGVGGYQFRDFLRAGIPLTLLVGMVIWLCLPLFYPLAQ